MSGNEGYVLLRKPVKHARIKLDDTGKLTLIVPEAFSEEDIDALLKHKKTWIEKQQEYFRNADNAHIEIPDGHILFLGSPIPCPVPKNNPSALKSWYKTQAKTYILNRYKELSAKHQLVANRIFIRDAKNAWGNCSKDRNLSFNVHLIKSPPYVIDYIILHELVHTIILKHTQAFWMKVALVCPDYKNALEWLNRYGKSILNQ